MSITELLLGKVSINLAEFMALLITCETFTSYCTNTITTIGVDNVSARSWFDRARCPRFPFDRCAQGLHLWMLKNAIKFKTSWVPSAENQIADICSRERFNMKSSGHCLFGARYRKIRPMWLHTTRFLLGKN